MDGFDSKSVMLVDAFVLRFGSKLGDLNLDSRPKECEKAKRSASIICQSSQLIWIEFGKLLKVVGVINLTLTYSVLFKGENIS